MAIIKESTNNECWRGCGEKGTLVHVTGNVNLCRMGNSMEFPQKN